MSKPKHPPLQVGERVGRWQVLAPAGSQNNMKYWRCQCDCGRTQAVANKRLKRGRAGQTDGSTQCRRCAGSEQRRFQGRAEPPSPLQAFDRIGDWLVLERGIRHGQRLWFCQCQNCRARACLTERALLRAKALGPEAKRFFCPECRKQDGSS